jgi:hypothetical protein
VDTDVEQVYRSKVDAWLVVVLVGVPVGMVDFLLDGVGIDDRVATLLMLGVVVAILGIFLWLCASTRYSIIGDFLSVRSGPFSWMIPIDEITSIEPTHNPASSPALSLDRLVIRYGRDAELMVSPKDKAGFVEALKKHSQRDSPTDSAQQEGISNV